MFLFVEVLKDRKIKENNGRKKQSTGKEECVKEWRRNVTCAERGVRVWHPLAPTKT